MAKMQQTPFFWENKESQALLNGGYLLDGEDVPAAIKRIAKAAASHVKKHPEAEEKFIELITQGYLSLASPVWANMGTERGLPISCFGSYIEDSIKSITYGWHEISMMTKHGGGTSMYFGNVRPKGTPIKDNGYSDGPMGFLEVYDLVIRKVSQGSVRRGKLAVYMDIDHPDIDDFLEIREKTSSIQDLMPAVCISDAWMRSMLDGDTEKRRIWQKLLRIRQERGVPYIFFTDNANKNKPEVYKNSHISHSNLCTEILLPDNPQESFVCCLSSMNIAKYKDWKDTDAVYWSTIFLDAVMSEFILKAALIKGMEKAVRFAENHRALGLGQLGLHTYIQAQGIPFDTLEGQHISSAIQKHISEEARRASIDLATAYGEPKMCKGVGRRNTVLTANAPCTTNAGIQNQVSPGIEPLASNSFLVENAQGEFDRRNSNLEYMIFKRLSEKFLPSKESETVWKSIETSQGSVQHLDLFNDREKEIYKTFEEMDQFQLVRMAAARQKFLDQGQSLNLQLPGGTPLKTIHKLMVLGWELGIPAFYYVRSTSKARNFVTELNTDTCKACEG